MISRQKWTNQEIAILKDKYALIPAKELAVLLNKSYGSILNKAKRLKIKSNKPFKHQKWFYDDYFFNKINNISCYVAGVIAADGYINKNKNKIIIHLSNKDREFLQNIANKLKFTGYIKEYVNKEKDGRIRSTIWLTLSNATNLINQLDKTFNITLYNKKNNILPPPNLSNKNHILSFIAGFIDGDGCISISKNNTLELSCIGSKMLCGWIRQQFINIFGDNFEKSHIYQHSQCDLYVYKNTGKKADIIIKKILSIPNIQDLLLKRKWDKLYESKFNLSN